MPCEFVELGEGADKVTAIICTRGQRRKRCACGKPATRECDYPKPTKRNANKTCDAALCVDCTTTVGPDRDLCAEHERVVREAGCSAELLADPDPHALRVAADLVGQKEMSMPKGRKPRKAAPPGGRELATQDVERPAEKLRREGGGGDPSDGAIPSAPIGPQPDPVIQPEVDARGLRVDRLLVRTRTDVFDTEAVDVVLDRAAFKPRDFADWQEFVEERAAVFEFLGERPRAVAEMMARQLAGPAPRYANVGPLFAGAR